MHLRLHTRRKPAVVLAASRSVGDSPPAAHGGGGGGGTRAVAAAAADGVLLVHEDLPAPALLAAERPVASAYACTSHTYTASQNTRRLVRRRG